MKLPKAAADPGAAIEALVSTLWPYFRPLVLEAIGGAPKAALVDIADHVPTSRRSLYRAARAGEIEGAVRVGRRWLAPREALDAWLRSRGPRVVEPPANDADALEFVRQRLANGTRKPQLRLAHNKGQGR
jgi:excisionase family DNA binding protein